MSASFMKSIMNGGLTIDSLLPIPNSDTIAEIEKIAPEFLLEKGEKLIPQLWVLLFRLFRQKYIFTFLIFVVFMALETFSPLMLKHFLIVFADTNSTRGQCIIAALQMSGLALFTGFVGVMSSKIQGRLVYSQAAYLRSMVHNKYLRMSSISRLKYSTGDLINIIHMEVYRISSVYQLQEVVIYPIAIIVLCFMLINMLGIEALFGISLLVLMMPYAKYNRKQIKESWAVLQKANTKRLEIVGELLRGIRVIKFYAWEKPFQKKVDAVREEQLVVLYMRAKNLAFTSFVFAVVPFLVGVISISIYAFQNTNVTPATVFSTLAILGILNGYMRTLPASLQFSADIISATHKVTQFFNQPERKLEVVQHNLEPGTVSLREASFSWNPEVKSIFNLRNLNLKVLPGELVAIVGTVGGGKSSFLAALMREMEQISGECLVAGRVTYVAQQPWIMNSTARENILFYGHYNELRYNEIIALCAMDYDFKILPAGDSTEIGERGINLSGGQKARIGLARAGYTGADVYLLDDPLSAVDNSVAHHIFENLIHKKWHGTTRLFVTHRMEFVGKCDKIAVIENGEIIEFGTPEELLKKTSRLKILMNQHDQNLTASENIILNSKSENLSNENKASKKEFLKENSAEIKTDLPAAKSRLTTDEINRKGKVQWRTSQDYVKALVPPSFLILFILSFVVSQILSHGSNIWLAHWTSELRMQNEVMFYIGIYAAIGLVAALIDRMRFFATYTGGVRAGVFFHKQLLSGILRAPTSFFDSTPVGRILNRFAGDMGEVDNNISSEFFTVLNSLVSLIGAVLVLSFTSPIILIVLVPVGFIYLKINDLSRAAVADSKRVLGQSRSPFLAHMSEIPSGVSFIVASNKEKDVNNALREKTSVLQKAQLTSDYISRWISLRMLFIGIIVTSIIAITVAYSKGHMNPGVAGLAMSTCLLITGQLNMLTRNMRNYEASLSCIERIEEYSNLPQENWEGLTPVDSWPQNGEILFKNTSFRYRADLPPTLKALDLKINAGEKIGIVGRTGAGKSSLFLMILRLVEPFEGEVFIDGVNLAHVDLETLRTRISIIPQDPVLFAGTFRENLDIRNEFSDADILLALQRAQLGHKFNSMPLGLETRIEEGGINFSVGERQLFCLARAILRQTKLLLVDEATASVDVETDAKIQQTLAAEFAGATVLTIAHRMGTIMNSERVIVLKDGRVEEFDTPQTLLASRDSLFADLAKAMQEKGHTG